MADQDNITLTRAQIEELRAIIHNADSPLGNRLQDVSSRLYFALDGAGWTPTAALSPATVAQPVEWGDPKTVGMFVRQLQTINPDTPIHAAVHTDIDGKRVALTKPVTISRERVQGRHIRQGDQSVPYSIVVWASHDEAAQPCPTQGCGGEGSVPRQFLIALDSLLRMGESHNEGRVWASAVRKLVDQHFAALSTTKSEGQGS